MKRVGFWLRSVALLIDVVIIVVCGSICAAVSGWSESERGTTILILFVWLIFSSLDVFVAASLGKLLLKLRIAKSDGTPADGWTLAWRWSTMQLPVISCLLYAITLSPGFYLLEGFSSLFVLVGCLFAANDSKQAWHDQMAKTAVFRRTKRPEIEAGRDPVLESPRVSANT